MGGPGSGPRPGQKNRAGTGHGGAGGRKGYSGFSGKTQLLGNGKHGNTYVKKKVFWNSPTGKIKVSKFRTPPHRKGRR